MDKCVFTWIGASLVLLVAGLAIFNLNTDDIVQQSVTSGFVIGYCVCWFWVLLVITYKTKWVE